MKSWKPSGLAIACGDGRRQNQNASRPQAAGALTHSQDRMGRAGFTLLELLSVISIFVIMAAVVGASFSHVRRFQIKAEAQKLSSVLRSARQYALENGVHTRVVFADTELEEHTEGRLPAGRAYGAYAFFKPTLPNGGSDYKPYETPDGLTPEFASMPFVSIPSGFVGQFRPLPGSEKWRVIDARVSMEAFVPEEAEIEAGFNRDFFDESNTLATLGGDGGATGQRYISQFYYNPAQFWDPDGRAYYLPNVPNAAYPLNYYQTPYPRAYPLKSSRNMPSEPSVFVANGNALRYDELWSDQAKLEFFHEIEKHAGNYKKLGQPESGSGTVRRFFDLKGIEFSPKGLPTLTWTEGVVFQFLPSGDEPLSAYEVTVDRNTGLAQVRAARDPRKDDELPGE